MSCYLKVSVHEIAGGGVFFGGKAVICISVLVRDVVADLANVVPPQRSCESSAEGCEPFRPTSRADWSPSQVVFAALDPARAEVSGVVDGLDFLGDFVVGGHHGGLVRVEIGVR